MDFYQNEEVVKQQRKIIQARFYSGHHISRDKLLTFTVVSGCDFLSVADLFLHAFVICHWKQTNWFAIAYKMCGYRLNSCPLHRGMLKYDLNYPVRCCDLQPLADIVGRLWNISRRKKKHFDSWHERLLILFFPLFCPPAHNKNAVSWLHNNFVTTCSFSRSVWIQKLLRIALWIDSVVVQN